MERNFEKLSGYLLRADGPTGLPLKAARSYRRDDRRDTATFAFDAGLLHTFKGPFLSGPSFAFHSVVLDTEDSA